MTRNRLGIVFTGGGTGGHLFPGLAVAEQIVQVRPHTRVTFAGSGKPLERRHVAAAGYEYLALRCRALPRRLGEVFAFLADNVAGYRAAARFLREQCVSVVVGLGGYASVPMARAALARGVPLVLLEQNVIPGRATRYLARSASLVCTAFEETPWQLRLRCPVRVSGTPIRSGFAAAARSVFRTAEQQLLILGGSGGAQAINQSVPQALHKLGSRLTDWKIVHQSGESGLGATAGLYRRLKVPAMVVPFIEDMPSVLAATDLAVCRAGGTTLAELAAAAVPAVLLPYPHAADDHQRRNAELFTTSGGSITLDQGELPGLPDDHLAGALSRLLSDPAGRARMSAAMRRLARPNAAKDVAALILEVINERSWQSRLRAAA